MKKSFYSILVLSVAGLVYACPSPDTNPSPTPTPTTKVINLGTSTSNKLSDFLWKKFNLKFKLPTTLKEIKNDDNEYFAENTAIHFDILPWAAQKLTQDDVLAEGIKNINLDKDSFKLDDSNIGTVTINTLQGFIVSGSGTENGIPLNLFILTFKDSAGNAYIINVKVYPDKLTQDDKDINIKSDIFTSFVAVPLPSPSPAVSSSTGATSVSPSPGSETTPNPSVTPSSTVSPGVSVSPISPTVTVSPSPNVTASSSL